MTTTMRLIQISDTHIFKDPNATLLDLNTAKSFEAVLDLVAANPIPPDVIILSGDLAQDATEEAYLYIAKRCERFSCAIYWIPGNHDSPEAMQQTFAKTQFKEDKAVLWGNWLLILLNTHAHKQVPGLLGRAELSRLEYFLTQHPNQHALVFMHHQPVMVGSQWLDNVGLMNAAEFFTIADQYPQIRGIIFGHVHQVYETYRQGIPILSAPSTSIQFLPAHKKFALEQINPGYRWFDLSPDGTFKTGVERVVNFDNTVDLTSEGY